MASIIEPLLNTGGDRGDLQLGDLLRWHIALLHGIPTTLAIPCPFLLLESIWPAMCLFQYIFQLKVLSIAPGRLSQPCLVHVSHFFIVAGIFRLRRRVHEAAVTACINQSYRIELILSVSSAYQYASSRPVEIKLLCFSIGVKQKGGCIEGISLISLVLAVLLLCPSVQRAQ